MPTSSPATAPASRKRPDLATDLRITVQRLSRRIRSESDPGDLTEAQYSVLAGLYRYGPSTPGAIAEREGVQPPSMTRTLASLEKDALVARSAHPTDGRQVVIDLTPAAEELLTEEVRAREAWLSGHLQELTAEERAVLREAAVIMDKLASG